MTITKLVEASEAGPIGLQRLWDVCTNEALKEENLFFEGGACLLQSAVGDEAVWRHPHENALTGGDVQPIETDRKTIFCLGFTSLLLREMGVYGDTDIRDGEQPICRTRCG
jgi:hypothetical protein